ncbi:dephospho-CoA kinase [Bacterioplanes sanyensis]|uniref:Dephospho-CoA kinase n=1 Tax=Bacterioplanes sanyensis TaxID=1249553 RepID=A0A222FIY3_9GAMM|nr:dephospho-CoA kinase [Bacterioplanes sanyensis]ASP38948.1 dephospho-CoA kinase [Bacterioplanes sanyensis]
MSTLTIGLTGGIGSGKSAAAAFFKTQGIVVVDADQVAREVVEPGEPAWQAIKKRFGSDALLPDRTLNRAWLRQRVFSDEHERQWLEQQTHPHIRERIVEQLQQASTPYAVLETPLLFESGQYELVDHSLVIDVDEDTQRARASQRDGNSEEQIRRIMAAQLSRQQRCLKADRIVDNSGTLAQLQQQLQQCHQHYLELSRLHES